MTELVSYQGLFMLGLFFHVKQKQNSLTQFKFFIVAHYLAGSTQSTSFILFFGLLIAVWPFSSDFWHEQGIFAQRTAAYCIFCLFRTILHKPQ